MEKLYGVPEIMDRYGCAERTARKIMRDMDHQEVPRLLVSERAVKAYIARNTMPPASEVRKMLRRKRA